MNGGMLRRQLRRASRPFYLNRYSLIAVAGALTAIGLSLGIELTDLDVPRSDALGALTLFSGLLPVVLILSSVYWTVVGMMFPEFSRATPVYAIRHSPFSALLDVMAFGLGYGAAVWLAELWLPANWVVVGVFIATNSLGLLLALQLVALSGVIIDPVRLAERLAAEAVDRTEPVWIRMAVGDLARLIPYLVEQQRTDATAAAIRHMASIWSRHAPLLDEQRRFAHGALTKAQQKWPGDARIESAISACHEAGLTFERLSVPRR